MSRTAIYSQMGDIYAVSAVCASNHRLAVLFAGLIHYFSLLLKDVIIALSISLFLCHIYCIYLTFFLFGLTEEDFMWNCRMHNEQFEGPTWMYVCRIIKLKNRMSCTPTLYVCVFNNDCVSSHASHAVVYFVCNQVLEIHCVGMSDKV